MRVRMAENDKRKTGVFLRTRKEGPKKRGFSGKRALGEGFPGKYPPEGTIAGADGEDRHAEDGGNRSTIAGRRGDRG
jgi:hypothetical protein